MNAATENTATENIATAVGLNLTPDAGTLPADQSSATSEEVDQNKRQLFARLGKNQADEVDNAQEVIEQQIQSPEEIIVGFIRQNSIAGNLTTRSVLLAPPYSIAEQDLARLLADIQSSELYTDIQQRAEASETYYYSTESISVNYANMCILVLEKDICKTIAEIVRFECETYPRPSQVQMFTLHPYYFTQQEIDIALASMDTHADYADIRSVSSSNDQAYLFSERFMSYGKAYGLCEWLAVEQYQNP